ncbi:MAG: hypothetical protein ACYS91_10855 [Planctomycetota bacterium]|jgi:hypothetical protein
MQVFRLQLSVIILCVLMTLRALGTAPEEGKQRIAVVVDPNIHNRIKRELRIYTQDLRNIGYSVITINKKWKTSFDLRTALEREYQEGLVGGVLVGSIPIPLYHRDKKSEPRPCVLALMDLDGVWKKDPTDSHYIEHPPQPDIFPEIWIGVIAPNSSRERQVKQFKRYFDKLHDFRKAKHSASKTHKALSFVELNWKMFTTMGLDVLYGDDVVVVNKPGDSSPGRLLTELRKDYEFVAIEAHNNAGFTGFKIFDEYGKRNDLRMKEIERSRPRTPFYNLFSCSVCCPTKTDYIGGSLIFETPGGVLVHGTTMTGGMNCPNILYKAWLTSGSFGEAFTKWFEHEIERDAKATNRHWYLGAIVLGDPALEFPHAPGKLIKGK